MGGVFTDRARQAMQLANQTALDWGHVYVRPEHVLIGIIREGSGIGVRMLNDCCGGAERLKNAIEQGMKKDEPLRKTQLPMSAPAKLAIESAIEYCGMLKHNYPGTEHILLGVLKINDPAVNAAFASIGVDPSQVSKGMLSLMDHDDKAA